MRLSLMKGAHAVLSRAAYRKFGASRSFFARCGIPQALTSSLQRSPPLRTGAPCSHQRTWAENEGRSPPQLFVPGPIAWSLGPKPTRTPPRLLRNLQGPGAPTGEEMKLPKTVYGKFHPD